MAFQTVEHRASAQILLDPQTSAQLLRSHHVGERARLDADPFVLVVVLVIVLDSLARGCRLGCNDGENIVEQRNDTSVSLAPRGTSGERVGERGFSKTDDQMNRDARTLSLAPLGERVGVRGFG